MTVPLRWEGIGRSGIPAAGCLILATLLLPALLFAGTLSLQERIQAAQPGDTLRVEPGVYQGPILIEKSITLIGIDRPRIVGDGFGHVLHVKSPHVHIEGFHISHSGSNLSEDHAGIMVEGSGAFLLDNQIEDSLHGIYVKKADSCRLEGNRIVGKTEKIVPLEDVMQKGFRPISSEMCAVDLNQNLRGNGIHLWNSRHITVLENHIRLSRDGIYFSFTDNSYVAGNTVEEVRYGLHYMYSDSNHFEDNTFRNNAAGAALMYSQDLRVHQNQFSANAGHRAYGLLIQSVDRSTIQENRIEQNTVGIYLENSNQNQFSGNRITANYVGVRLTASSSGNRFFRNTLQANLHHAEFDQANPDNHWASPEGTGNRWGGIRIIDLNGDGIGEFPHHETNLFGPIRRGFPAIGLLSGSPGTRVLQFMESKLQIPDLPSLTDPGPLALAPPRASPEND